MMLFAKFRQINKTNVYRKTPNICLLRVHDRGLLIMLGLPWLAGGIGSSWSWSDRHQARGRATLSVTGRSI